MDLRVHGLSDTGPIQRNLPPALLIERALQRSEGLLASNGALTAYTSPHTGRAAREKYAVRRPQSEQRVWWGAINQPVDAAPFERVLESIRAHMHSGAFLRVRIGIGKPPGRQAGADYVLKPIRKAEQVELDVAVVEAAESVETIFTDGVAVAMNRFN